MKSEDKEAFEKFVEEDSLSQMEHSLFLAMSENQRIMFTSERSWQAACEHKQKEIDRLHKDIEFLLVLHGYDPVNNDQEIVRELKLKYL